MLHNSNEVPKSDIDALLENAGYEVARDEYMNEGFAIIEFDGEYFNLSEDVFQDEEDGNLYVELLESEEMTEEEEKAWIKKNEKRIKDEKDAKADAGDVMEKNPTRFESVEDDRPLICENAQGHHQLTNEVYDFDGTLYMRVERVYETKKGAPGTVKRELQDADSEARREEAQEAANQAAAEDGGAGVAADIEHGHWEPDIRDQGGSPRKPKKVPGQKETPEEAKRRREKRDAQRRLNAS